MTADEPADRHDKGKDRTALTAAQAKRMIASARPARFGRGEAAGPVRAGRARR